MSETKGIRTDLEIRALTCPDELPFVEESIRDPKLPGFRIRAYRGAEVSNLPLRRYT
jgi:hypothetical protein